MLKKKKPKITEPRKLKIQNNIIPIYVAFYKLFEFDVNFDYLMKKSNFVDIFKDAFKTKFLFIIK